ncbi:hypothetical protein [Caulobacter phage Cr30]|uniref:hypothetical protein n=1 Tax=Caulobacter phage Cr30 TaxID=1357714 RepID=UPI0004A9BB0D|nr:hypothetical protein OZ74_gp051 [Caulobacter phage Cr30]AGS80936.1 hypothetical protein [Caulobacter phage Cr30]
MGFNTPILILNDHLNNIENDELFGSRISAAIYSATQLKHRDAIPGWLPGGKALESCHADTTRLIVVGQNDIKDVAFLWGVSSNSSPEEILKSLARELGYSVRKK